jgi:hypothetical protein
MATTTEKKERGTLINILDLDPVEGVKGISFDPDVEYTFKVTERQTRKLEKDDGSGHKKEFVVIEMMCTEQESQATIKQSFFYSNKGVTINEDDHEKESPVVKFARGIGYPVGIGKKFSYADVVREGIEFKAKVKPQIDRSDKSGKTLTGYSEIDLMTVKGIKVPGAKAQTKISGSPDDEQFLINMALGFPNKEKLIGGVAAAGKANLINLLMSLDEQGKLKYSSK